MSHYWAKIGSLILQVASECVWIVPPPSPRCAAPPLTVSGRPQGTACMWSFVSPGACSKHSQLFHFLFSENRRYCWRMRCVWARACPAVVRTRYAQHLMTSSDVRHKRPLGVRYNQFNSYFVFLLIYIFICVLIMYMSSFTLIVSFKCNLIINI